MSYLTRQVLQPDFGDISDGAQAVALRALPLVDGLFVDGVPQLLSAVLALLLVQLKGENKHTKSQFHSSFNLIISRYGTFGFYSLHPVSVSSSKSMKRPKKNHLFIRTPGLIKSW